MKPSSRAYGLFESFWPAHERISSRISDMIALALDRALAAGWQDAADALRESAHEFDRDDHAHAAADWLEKHAK